jgi:hypothetical protein
MWSAGSLQAEGSSQENIKRKDAAGIKLPLARIKFNAFALCF